MCLETKKATAQIAEYEKGLEISNAIHLSLMSSEKSEGEEIVVKKNCVEKFQNFFHRLINVGSQNCQHPWSDRLLPEKMEKKATEMHW